MANTRYWLSTSNDLTATAAWSGGVVPITGDTAIFPATSTIAPTANLSGLSAVTLALWYVEDGCPLELGYLGNPIAVGATNFVLFGDGNQCLSNQTTANTSTIIVAPTRNSAQINLLGNSFKNIWCASGMTLLTTAGYSTGAIFVSRSPNGQVPNLSVQSSAGSGLLTLAVNAGTVHYASSSGVNTVYQSGGSIQCTGTGGIASLYQSGGYHDFRSTQAMALAHIMGGTFDLTQGYEARTVTFLIAYPGARYLRDPNISTVSSETILLDQAGIT